MKLDVYICDKCGAQDERWHCLSTTFSSERDGNFGVRHLCDKCKKLFKAHFERFFTLHNTIKKAGFKQLKTTHQRYADVFEALGFSIDLTNFKSLAKKEYNKNLLNLLGKKKKSTIGIAPFAAYKSKMYPLALIKKVLADLDKEHHYQIVLFGGGTKEITQLDTFENEFNSVINIAGKLNFTEELALISNLDVMISMDSGNGHLGAMYGVPIISLWGVTHPFAGFAPFGQPNDNSLFSDNKKYPSLPTSIYGNNYPEEYENAMESIKPEEIVKKVESVLKLKK